MCLTVHSDDGSRPRPGAGPNNSLIHRSGCPVRPSASSCPPRIIASPKESSSSRPLPCAACLHGQRVPLTLVPAPGDLGAAAPTDGVSPIGPPTPGTTPRPNCVVVAYAGLVLVWREVLVFVQPAIVLASQHTRFREHRARLNRKGQPSRPAISRDARDLIREISRTNPRWGSPRILGTLRKLGIGVAHSTVEKYRVRPWRPSSSS